jgi:spermidine/putrescine transport system permease protein
LPAGEAVARAETAARRREVRRSWWLAAPALALLLIGASGPLVIVLLYSFLEPGAYSGVVWEFSTEAWFRVVFNRDIFDDTISLADAHLTIFWRSVSLSLMTTLLTLALGFPTAYFIATRPERQRPLWLFLITIPFWTNLLIRTFAIMEVIRNEGILNSLLLGLGLIESPVQILYTNTAVMIGMVYVYLPLMVLPLYAAMERLDFRLVEAAYDLYASRLRVLRRVIVPLVRPGIIAGSILVFVPALGAYVTPRVLGGGKRMMLGNLIELQFGQGRNWPLGAALAVTLLLIVGAALVVYVRSAAPDDHGR